MLTLPAPVRRALPKGTTDFRISQREDGVIELHPQMMIDASQAWFWTERWQEREREVDEHITAGRVREAKDADEVLAHLDSLDR
ncbi:MAG: AbrB family transcriptional regulator [Chloroflexi bacterium]|nr:AbrB family transcriptional regulator [Chloroflexota bacterium]